MNYQHSLRNNPEQHSSHLLCGKSLKLCRSLPTVFGVSAYCSQKLQEEEQEQEEEEEE